ncbi:MAG TPA: fimbria/pilus periplasmic chaperone [Scandinavium sp.]|jgi:chaperone protein EcpD
MPALNAGFIGVSDMVRLKGVLITRLAFFLSLSVISQTSLANVVVGATRIIYPELQKEVTVKLSNNEGSPVLAQTWIDKGDVNAQPEKLQVPFIIMPPINRIDAGKSQTLRITYTGSSTLPSNKETAFWLNVLEIPPVGKNRSPNKLQIAFRTRIKLFYRPESLGKADKAIAAAESLEWASMGKTIIAKNNSPFYVSLVSVSDGSGHSVEGEMVPPFGETTFTPSSSMKFSPGAKVSYEYVNDWGAVKSINKNVK